MEDVTKDPDSAPIDGSGPESLSVRIDAVERLLLELLEHTAQEVRTRRLAVIEDDGFERVVLEAGGSHGEITVAARGDGRGATAAELYAHDASEGDEATAGVALVRDGDLRWTHDLLAHPDAGSPG